DERERGGGELPLARMTVGLAQGFELLEVGELANVDLDREVAPDRVLQRLAGLEVAAREGPAARERLFAALPEEHLEHALANLEHGGEGHLCRAGCFRLTGGNRARLSRRF